MSIALASATVQAAALRSKEISARELLLEHLDRIARIDPALHAVVALDEDRALRRAGELDELLARGQAVGPLHGLPCTVKDALDTAGLVTTGGSSQLAGRVPSRDAAAVGRVRAAGAVVFGKTNLPAWSADFQTDGGLHGRTNNPWDLTRTPGGSSGGAAAAVAAGLSAFEIGTDIGGSIRVPSALCGVTGLKPTFGAVPQRGYVAHADGGTELTDLNVVGPLARSVGDLELLLGVLAGPEHPDSGWSLDLREPASAPWRIGVLCDAVGHPVAREVRSAVEAAAAALVGAGSHLDEEPPPVTLDEGSAVFIPLITAATSLSFDGGPSLSHRDWLRADIAREALRTRWRDWFSSHDALLLPVWPTTAPPHSTDPLPTRVLDVDGTVVPTLAAATPWLDLAGVAGLPSCSVRVGTGSDGLPIGVQVVGGAGRDRTCLAIAARLEALLGGHPAPPLARSTAPEATG